MREKLTRIKRFYDEEYYSDASAEAQTMSSLPWHSRLIALRVGDSSGQSILDVACGKGEWLAYMKNYGCKISGVDISEKAIEFCKLNIKEGEFVCCPAESLPFGDTSFDLITCLGSLEHFVDNRIALREMVRVAKPNAKFLILVPNSGFLTRKFGLYAGTNQAYFKEDVLSLDEWKNLLAEAGLRVTARWRDLHMLNFTWINRGHSPLARILRMLQALALVVWPLGWQYQVYYYCERERHT